MTGVGPVVRRVTSVVQQEEVFKLLGHLTKERTDVFQVRLMRGLLALEVGDTAEAAKHFRGCLRTCPATWPHPDAAIARRYLELFRRRNDEGVRDQVSGRQRLTRVGGPRGQGGQGGQGGKGPRGTA